MSAQRTALMAGICYLAVAVFGLFAQYVARGSVRVIGDAAATERTFGPTRASCASGSSPTC